MKTVEWSWIWATTCQTTKYLQAYVHTYLYIQHLFRDIVLIHTHCKVCCAVVPSKFGFTEPWKQLSCSWCWARWTEGLWVLHPWIPKLCDKPGFRCIPVFRDCLYPSAKLWAGAPPVTAICKSRVAGSVVAWDTGRHAGCSICKPHLADPCMLMYAVNDQRW